MGRNLTAHQLRLVEELMPKILLALTTADNAARGYGYRGHGIGRRYDIAPAEGLANLKALELGALIDRLNDWCWCAEDHDGACPEPVLNDSKVGRENNVAAETLP